MSYDDDELLARFNNRLAGIENEIPSPRETDLRGAGSMTHLGRQRRMVPGWIGATVVAAGLVALAVIGFRLWGPPGPAPTAPAVGHTARPSTAPSPTYTPARSPSPSTSTSAPTPSPTSPLMPPATRSPSQSPTAIPTPTEPPSADVWRRVAEWPIPRFHVAAVLAGGPGFVAVGYDADDSLPCGELTVDGRIWTSSDGEHWTESRPEALAGLSLRRAVNADGTFYAFGQVGDSNCSVDYQPAVVRSTDGTNWERLQSDLPDSVWIAAVGATGANVLVVSEDTSWTSVDGTHWRRAGGVPFSYSWFEEIAEVGGASVLFEGYAANPVSFSEDAGESWRPADVDPPYNLVVDDVVSDDHRIVAVGSACCALPNERAGVTMVSTDGEHWAESAPFRDVPQAVVGVSGGYLAIGRATWVSSDGLDWRVGPSLPDVGSTEEVLAVSADVGVLVVNAGAAWFAPSDELTLERWTDTPPAPAMPEMGVRYPVVLLTHCGFPDVHFGLRPWVADPPFEDNINPPPGFRDEDHGWLTQLSADELRYENRGGRTVKLVPSEPVNVGPCA